ncbi:MAG TPA: DUF4062 domain-containing protein [Chitinophagaceae bacterium]
MGHKVYISSVYSEFDETRKVIIQYINERAQLYELTGMENYGAEDRRILQKCIDDVNNTEVYICILGYKYGSIAIDEKEAANKISFTHWEFNTACEKKSDNKKIERLIYLKEAPNLIDNDARLTQLKKSIKESQTILCRIFQKDEDLPKMILKDLDNYIARITNAAGISENEKYFCDREEQSMDFDQVFFIKKKAIPIHFFLLSGRDKDSHLSFTERYRCLLKSKNNEQEIPEIICNIKINPPSNENKIAESIKWKINQNLMSAFNADPLQEMNAANVCKLLKQQKKNYIIINLFVQSTYFKESFTEIYKRGFTKFYNDFSGDATGCGDIKIIFFLLLTYPDNAADEIIFNTAFDDDPFFLENKLPPLNKITALEIKDWLRSRHIEENPTHIKNLITTFFCDWCQNDTDEFFMSDAEIGMEKVIFHYNNQIP